MRTNEARRDERREERIRMKIMVDAYGSEEQAMGWYYYLEDQLQFPFTALCIKKCVTSPLQLTDEVDVMRMPSEEECEKEMFVMIRWENDCLAVPLSQLKPTNNTDAPTREAIEDWHYWLNMGYEFG